MRQTSKASFSKYYGTSSDSFSPLNNSYLSIVGVDPDFFAVFLELSNNWGEAPYSVYKGMLVRSILNKTGKSLLFVGIFKLVSAPILLANNSGDFNYTTDSGEITITNYIGPGGNVTIPDTIGSLPVTTIGDYAFNFRTDLISVEIPDSVTRVGNYAFYRCDESTGVSVATTLSALVINHSPYARNYPALKFQTMWRLSGTVPSINVKT